MVLKPQDVLVLLKLLTVSPDDSSFASLGQALYMSPSEVHAGVKRAQIASLYAEATREPIKANLLEFLVHGVKYAFPAQLGSQTRGIPTAHAASPLRQLLAQDNTLPPVWPHPEGPTAGLSFAPIYKSAPRAALHDPVLYEYLALVDTLRAGRAREQRLAADILTQRLQPQGAVT
jgi:hypothetical protein